MQKLSVILVLLAIAQFAQGQKILPGVCNYVPPLKKFFADSYSGLWYQYASYPFVFEIAQKCVTAEYGILGPKTVSVRNSAISEITGKTVAIEGEATVLGPGRLNVKFPQGGIFPQSDRENYVVVATDYETYSVVTACTNLLASRAQFVWCLTRDRNPSQETIAKINEVLEANKISTKYLKITNQDGCPPTNP